MTREIIAEIRLAPGEVGYYDDYSRLYLSTAKPSAYIYAGMNTTQIRKSIRSGRLRLISGSLTGKPAPKKEEVKKEAPQKEEVKVEAPAEEPAQTPVVEEVVEAPAVEISETPVEEAVVEEVVAEEAAEETEEKPKRRRRKKAEE